MPMFIGRVEKSFNFLTTDPQAIGVVTWFGLVVTIAGFWIAIAQLRKVKTSSTAAAEAVSNLTRIVRSQQQNTHITSAIGHLMSAQATMPRNTEATAVHLTNAWTALLAAREMTASEAERLFVGSIVLSTRQLLDDLTAPPMNRVVSAELSAARHAAMRDAISELGSFSARLNAALLGIGPSS